MELLYSTVSTFSPGSRIPSSISSLKVMPPALGLPVQIFTLGSHRDMRTVLRNLPK